MFTKLTQKLAVIGTSIFGLAVAMTVGATDYVSMAKANLTTIIGDVGSGIFDVVLLVIALIVGLFVLFFGLKFLFGWIRRTR